MRRRVSLLLLSAGVLTIIAGGVAAGLVYAFPSPSYSATVPGEVPNEEDKKIFGKPVRPVAAHLPTPPAVKAIYMSQCVVGTPSFRDSLVSLIEETELNSVVIDIKDYTGKISFTTDNPKLRDFVSDECGAVDMRAFIETLHEKNIYVIGRITVFQDPYYSSVHPDLAVKRTDGSVWKDYKGLSFIDVGARPYWEYIVELSKESYALGFDELNYDYIRFPSDGNMSDIYFSWSQGKTKPEALETFFEYLAKEVRPTGAKMSADLFGMTTNNYDDLNIGQVLERALPYFDYIAPMVYPSHYPDGFNGWADPNEHVYDIIAYAMGSAVERVEATTTPLAGFTHTRIGTTTPARYRKEPYPATVLRPWLQDFDYGGDYGPKEVRDQIQATYDVGLTSWMLWAPSNRYTKEALHKE